MPTPRPTAVQPGESFDISWEPVSGGGAPSVDGSLSDPIAWSPFVRSLRWGTGAIVTYPTFDAYGPRRGPMIWRSDDLLAWRRVIAPGPEGRMVQVMQVVEGGPGLVALGTDYVEDADEAAAPVLWVSADGEHWEERRELPEIAHVWAWPGVIVGFGKETWISSDGSTWQHAGSSPFAQGELTNWVDIVDDGSSAVVFLLANFEAPTGVFRLTPDGTWQHLADLPGRITLGARGPRGFVALGEDDQQTLSWVSADAVTWDSSPAPPLTNIAIVPQGYVGLSQRSYYQGCDGADPSQQIAQTWTSGDGIKWRQMPEDPHLDHVDLPLLFLDANRLLAVGLKWSPDGGSSEFEDRATASVWQTQPFVEPPAHSPLPVAEGCGGD